MESDLPEIRETETQYVFEAFVEGSYGMNARRSVDVVRVAQNYPGEISIIGGGNPDYPRANAKEIMSILCLGAYTHAKLEVLVDKVKGEDATGTIAGIYEAITRFHKED